MVSCRSTCLRSGSFFRCYGLLSLSFYYHSENQLKAVVCGSVCYFNLCISLLINHNAILAYLTDCFIFGLCCIILGGTSGTCHIPNHRLPGRCIAANKCLAFEQLYIAVSETPESIELKQRFIREIRCDRANNGWSVDKVCCPLKGKYK